MNAHPHITSILLMLSSHANALTQISGLSQSHLYDHLHTFLGPRAVMLFLNGLEHLRKISVETIEHSLPPEMLPIDPAVAAAAGQTGAKCHTYHD